MSKKDEYYFNSEDCEYQIIKKSPWQLIKNVIKWSFFIAITTFSLLILINKYYTSPEEFKIKTENENLKKGYKTLSKELVDIAHNLEKLKQKENTIFKYLFGIESADKADKKKNIEEQKVESNSDKEKIIEGLCKKVANSIKIIDKKYNLNLQLLNLSNDGLVYLSHIPTILPIKSKQLKKFGAGYGYKKNLFFSIDIFHYGQDIIVPKGTKVFATASGVVEFAKFSGHDGNIIKIDHKNGFFTEYRHLSEILIKKGKKVHKGQLIAKSGNTGTKSICPHLHYAILKENRYINPIDYFCASLSPKEFSNIKRHVSNIKIALD